MKLRKRYHNSSLAYRKHHGTASGLQWENFHCTKFFFHPYIIFFSIQIWRKTFFFLLIFFVLIIFFSGSLPLSSSPPIVIVDHHHRSSPATDRLQSSNVTIAVGRRWLRSPIVAVDRHWSLSIIIDRRSPSIVDCCHWMTSITFGQRYQ